jgi:hypothetical protein
LTAHLFPRLGKFMNSQVDSLTSYDSVLSTLST